MIDERIVRDRTGEYEQERKESFIPFMSLNHFGITKRGLENTHTFWTHEQFS